MRLMTKKNIYRVAIYLLGLFILAAGSICAVNSNLGVSPVNSLPYALSLASGIELGTCVTAVFLAYILVQAALLRREAKPVQLALQLVFSMIYGAFVNLMKALLGGFSIPGYPGRLMMTCVSILFVSLGLTFYLSADIVPMPMEGMTLVITKVLRRFKFHNVKIVVDSANVLIACIVSFAALGALAGIREGTVIAAVITGRVISMISKPLRPHLERLCFGERGDSALPAE